jgi:hypothetical protein
VSQPPTLLELLQVDAIGVVEEAVDESRERGMGAKALLCSAEVWNPTDRVAAVRAMARAMRDRPTM